MIIARDDSPWYPAAQVTLPGEGQSFALIYSIEDPSRQNKFSGLGAQVCLVMPPHCTISAESIHPRQLEHFHGHSVMGGIKVAASAEGNRYEHRATDIIIPAAQDTP